jgi:hypothetical protein
MCRTPCTLTVFPKMDAFLATSLTPNDKITFVKAFQIALQLRGKDKCWCLKRRDQCNHTIFQGFTTSKKVHLSYRGRDARPLLLAMAGQEPDPLKPIIVRRSICESQYCLNPSHYYWGTRADVARENNERNKTGINNTLISRLRQESESGISSLKLSKTYRLPYQTVRRICNYETYIPEEVNENPDKQLLWKNIAALYKKLTTEYSTEADEFNLNYHMKNNYECPWHAKGSTTHKGNFGLMGECLDCMKEIKNDRCTIDVRNFDFRWHWQIKRFWDQVDIGEDDECWAWNGSTKKNGSESVAYFPSPFHSGKTQSASRVAFWLSRGYTGKYRIFTKKSCKPFCCNPLHLTIKELENESSPTKLQCVKLTHDNIFKHYKERKDNSEKESSDS